MERMVRSNMAALEEGGEKALNLIRGIHTGAPRQTVEDEQMASLNYDLMEDSEMERALYAPSADGKKSSNVHGHVLTFLQLLLTVAVAFLTAAAMFFVSHIVESCSEWRVESTLEPIGAGRPYEAYFVLLAISLFLASISTVLVVFFAPAAKGGGVPYVQAYLNGTNVSSFFSVRIVLVKVLALGFVIASGMSLGMEGPFVFIGSGIAIILNKSLDLFSFHQRLGGRYTRILKNINEERVFMAGGMAAGLAVAFNAPIAGVLMALEGSTAFLTVPVVLRIFGCAMFATFFNDVAHANFGPNIKTHNLIVISSAAEPQEYAWVIWEIAAFAGVAVIGGALGALAIWVNVKVTRWRHHHVEPHPPANKLNTSFAIKEVLGIMALTASVWFVLPYIFGCREQHEQCFPTVAIPHRCTPVQCPSSFYSEIGTIVFSTPDTIARILFDRTLLPENEVSPLPLLVYAAFYMCFVAVVYGAHVPGGLFVPSVVVGACVGRAFGVFLQVYVSGAINPGVYALLGAASMFGGFTRLVLPAAVMLIEMSGDSTYLLPIMFCTAVAKVVSDQIVPPLYPQHMAIEGIPTLGDKLNPLIAPLQAKHIMSRSFYSVRQLDSLEHILHVLDHSKSMLLPVVSADGQDKFVGMIMRRSVLYALKYTKLYKDQEEFLEETGAAVAGAGAGSGAGGSGVTQRRASSSMLEIEKAMGDVRNTKKAALDTNTLLGSEGLEDKFAGYLVNLTPFMDAGALTAHEETSAKRIAAIFRRLGISHLGVADGSNKLVGIITRRHLIKPPAVLPPNTPHLAPQQAVAQLLEKEDLEASPETVLDLASYDPSLALEAEAMRPLGANQNRLARAARRGRTQSIFAGGSDDPAVRFDDEEDALPATEAPGAQSLASPAEGDESADAAAAAAAGVDDTAAFNAASASAAGQQQFDAEAPGDDDDINATGGSINVTGGSSGRAGGSGPTPRTKAKQSSLMRLNNYTKQV